MQSTQIEIKNAEGFHLRPAQIFSQAASKFSSEIKVTTDTGQEANPKSVLGLIALGLAQGAILTITASGEDEEQAVAELAELAKNGFGE